MSRILMSLGGAAMSAVATLALSPAAWAAPAREAPQPPVPSAPAPAAQDATRYCVLYTPTGSRIERKQCKTKTEWQSLGVDIEAELQARD